QAALAVAAVLIAENAALTLTITAQSVRTKEAKPFLINGADRLRVRHRRPNQSIHFFHRLDLRFDDAHFLLTIPPDEEPTTESTFYNTVVRESDQLNQHFPHPNFGKLLVCLKAPPASRSCSFP